MRRLTVTILLFISICFCVSGETCQQTNDQSNSTALKCLSCTSDADGEDCLLRPSSLLLKQCKSTVNKCYIYVSGNLTQRGCVGDDVIPESRICDDDYCRFCSDRSLCNIDELPTEKCISFSFTKDHIDEISGHSKSKQCSPSVRKQGCYQKIDGTKVYQGCVNELPFDDRAECRDNGNRCKLCFGDNCNYKADFEQCFTCDTKSDQRCLYPTLYEGDALRIFATCSRYNDECYSFLANNTVYRGCLSKASDEVIQSCRSNKHNCKTCFNDPKCNFIQVTDTCIVCDSDTDPSCRDSTSRIPTKFCSLNDESQSEGCYLRKINGTVTRGCVNDLSSAEKASCRNQSDECQICKHKDCNRKVDFRQTCLECDGQRNSIDNECTLGKTRGSRITCDDYSSSCIVGIDSRGFTHRGCSSNRATDERIYPNGYELCTENYCNNRVFPLSRLNCYQCVGSDCDYSNPISKQDDDWQPCNIYKDFREDRCYAFAYGIVYRGCMSDKTRAREMCEKMPQHCKICNENGCNHFWMDANGAEVSTKIFRYFRSIGVRQK